MATLRNHIGRLPCLLSLRWIRSTSGVAVEIHQLGAKWVRCCFRQCHVGAKPAEIAVEIIRRVSTVTHRRCLAPRHPCPPYQRWTVGSTLLLTSTKRAPLVRSKVGHIVERRSSLLQTVVRAGASVKKGGAIERTASTVAIEVEEHVPAGWTAGPTGGTRENGRRLGCKSWPRLAEISGTALLPSTSA